MNTKGRIVGIMEIMTISTTTAERAKRRAMIKKKKKEEEEEEWNREGRGRYPLGIQDDKGGRGGNHSQETTGSNIDTLQNNTNTTVVHQKDNTAQHRGKNEQKLTANGKSDNVSPSPQQTGAQEDAAG